MGAFADIGWLLGNGSAQGEDDQALRLQQQAYDQFGNLKTPELQQVRPEQEGPTELNGIRTDPALRQAQMSALQGLQQRGVQGYNVEDRAANQATQNDFNQAEQGSRGAIAQTMQARGMGGSGNELAMQLANQQGSANRANMAGAQLAAASRRNALQAMMAGGQQAGQMRGQEYGEQANRASAQDAINARNAAMRQRAGYYNAGLGQQNFENQMGLAGARSGAAHQLSGAYTDRGNRARQTGQTVGDIGDDVVATGVKLATAKKGG